MLASGCQSEPRVTEGGMDIPEGAVAIGDEVWAVPLDYLDEDGCRPWRLWSPTKMVIQALHYREPGGGFTTNKLAAQCMQQP